MKKKQIGGLIVAAILFIVIGASSVLTNTVSEKMLESGMETLLTGDYTFHAPLTDYIGVVRVEGTIQEQTEGSALTSSSGYQHTTTLEYIDHLMEDPRTTKRIEQILIDTIKKIEKETEGVVPPTFSSDKKLSEHADYCYPIVAKKIGGRYYCQHNFVHQYWNASESEASKLIGEIEDLSSVQLKDENRLLLPSAIKKNKVVIVSVVGVTQSGKSTFLSSLFRTGAEIPDLQQIGNKLYPYVGNATFFGLKSKVVTSNSTNEVNGGLSKKMLASYYNVVSKTSNDPKKNPIIAQIPYVVQLDRIQGTSSGAYLSFFDAPGGVFLAGDGSQVMQGNSDPTMILRSDCIILLINATPQNGEDGGIGLGDAQSILNAIIKRREDAGNARRKDAENASSDIPLAIVLCKFDEFASKFDSNSYVRMQSPIATGNKYGGSRMQTYIDRCSDEVEAFICTAKDSGAFMECLEGFPNRKFFAVSSIGRNDSIVCDDNGPEYRTVYYSEPKHVEHVLLWLMYKTGAIV